MRFSISGIDSGSHLILRSFEYSIDSVSEFETLKNGGAIMAEKGFKRNLTAILSADVEGYRRFINNDE